MEIINLYEDIIIPWQWNLTFEKLDFYKYETRINFSDNF